MQTYYSSLNAIHQQTMQLQSEQCKHCGQSCQLVSHGFVHKKQAVAQEPQAVGKRVFCSNRHHRTGCGRTMQLYLDSSLRRMHYTGSAVVIFMLMMLNGASITLAYTQVSKAQTPRHAYRWLQRFHAQMSVYRSLLHQPPLDQPTAPCSQPHCLRRSLLNSTLTALLARFKHSLCQAYQSQLQQAFL